MKLKYTNWQVGQKIGNVEILGVELKENVVGHKVAWVTFACQKCHQVRDQRGHTLTRWMRTGKEWICAECRGADRHDEKNGYQNLERTGIVVISREPKPDRRGELFTVKCATCDDGTVTSKSSNLIAMHKDGRLFCEKCAQKRKAIPDWKALLKQQPIKIRQAAKQAVAAHYAAQKRYGLHDSSGLKQVVIEAIEVAKIESKAAPVEVVREAPRRHYDQYMTLDTSI